MAWYMTRLHGMVEEVVHNAISCYYPACAFTIINLQQRQSLPWALLLFLRKHSSDGPGAAGRFS